MTSSFKAQTEPIQPLLSGENTEAPELPSGPSVGTDNTAKNTATMPKQSRRTLPAATTELDNKTVLSALMLKAALSRLLKNGLIKQYQVLSADRTTVKEIQIVLDPAIWTTDYSLRSVVEAKSTPTTPATTDPDGAK